MRIQPFSFIKEPLAAPTPPPPSFPTLSGTLVDYWESINGVTGTSNVSAWVGEQNGETLTYLNSTGPAVSSSNAGFNSQDTLAFNGVDQGLGKIFSNEGGTNTGDVYMSIYAAPHGDGSDWGAMHGLSNPATPSQPAADFVECMFRATSTTQIQMYSYPGGLYSESDDDTYGKGIYTLVAGSSQGRKFFNKGTTANANGGAYSSYKTNRQGFTLGAYNFNSPRLYGKVDIAGVVIWTNPTDYASDINAIETYFQAIYG